MIIVNMAQFLNNGVFLKIFTEFAEFSDKKYLSLQLKGLNKPPFV